MSETAYELGVEGREASYANASDEWKAQAFAALQTVAQTQPTFIADSVWELLGGTPQNRSTGSAMGGVFVRAVRLGLIENTGTFQRCERAISHGKPLPLWRSLIYTGEVSE
jgi:hypothetical protein